MNKKIFSLLLIVTIFITGCSFNKKSDNYSKEFKEIYESKNNKKSSKGDTFREIKISEDNVYQKTTIDEVAKMIKNKETFYLYTGDEECPWCRATIEMADEISREMDIDKIYYLELWDENHNELFRNVKEFMLDKTIVETKEVSSSYKTLLDICGSILKKYEIFDKDGNKEILDEYRVYGANYFYIKDGKLKAFTNSIPESLKDKSMPLTEEIKRDERLLYEDFFSNSVLCDSDC